MKKIAIIGCGHGGQALAGHFAIMGHSVNIYAHPKHPGGLKTIQETGKVECTGAIEGIGNIALCTSSMEKALDGVDVIFVSLPVVAHESIFINMLPFLEDNQIVINLSGHFSGMFQHEIMKRAAWDKEILIADVTSFPYACRAQRPGLANIIAIKNKVGIASFNIHFAEKIKSAIQDFFPSELEIKSSFIETGLFDPSGISHPPTVMFNAGRIGNGSEFYFYKDGVSSETALYLESIDAERIQIGKLLGMNLPKYHEVMNEYYGLKFQSLFEFFKHSPIHNKSMLCPKSLKDRYVTEDVPFTLVPWFSLGDNLGFVSKSMRNVIDVCSILNQRDYLSMGRKITKEHIKTYHELATRYNALSSDHADNHSDKAPYNPYNIDKPAYVINNTAHIDNANLAGVVANGTNQIATVEVAYAAKFARQAALANQTNSYKKAVGAVNNPEDYDSHVSSENEVAVSSDEDVASDNSEGFFNDTKVYNKCG